MAPKMPTPRKLWPFFGSDSCALLHFCVAIVDWKGDLAEQLGYPAGPQAYTSPSLLRVPLLFEFSAFREVSTISICRTHGRVRPLTINFPPLHLCVAIVDWKGDLAEQMRYPVGPQAYTRPSLPRVPLLFEFSAFREVLTISICRTHGRVHPLTINFPSGRDWTKRPEPLYIT